MIWVWGGLALVVAAALAVVGIGWMLPVQHLATRSLVLRQSPEAVWDTITAVEEGPRWRKGLKSVEILDSSPGKRRWTEHGAEGVLTLAEEQADRPRGWLTRLDDPKLPFGGSWRFELTADGGGTRLRITEAGEVYHPVFRFMSRFVFGQHKTVEVYLKAVAAKFGEAATIEP